MSSIEILDIKLENPPKQISLHALGKCNIIFIGLLDYTKIFVVLFCSQAYFGSQKKADFYLIEKNIWLANVLTVDAAKKY